MSTYAELIEKGYTPDGRGGLNAPGVGRNRARGLAPSPQPEPSPAHGAVAQDAGESPKPVRRLVRITSFRVRLLDDDNPCPKFIIDALKIAGIIFDDSQEFAKIELSQVKVEHFHEERTHIKITPIIITCPTTK